MFIGILLAGNDLISNTHKIGSNSFTVPTGYEVTNSSKDLVNMTNGTHEMTLIIGNEKNLNKAIDDYKSRTSEKYNVTVSDLTLGNTPVKKTETKSSNNEENKIITKYWFMKNNKRYTIQSFNSSDSIEQIAPGIINSIK